MFLYHFIKEWCKNPHWSFSCCLALLVPLNDLQEELGGLEEANVLQSQLQTGQIEKPSILSSVTHSGVIDVTLRESEHDDEKMLLVQCEIYQDTVYSDTRRHRGTQTELCPIFLVHGPKADSTRKGCK